MELIQNFLRMMYKTKYFIIVLLTTQLSGCIGLFIAGAVTTTAIVADSRDLQTSNTDKSLRHQIYRHITKDEELKDSNITIASFHKIILLTGQASNSMLKIKAEKIAKSIPGVEKVYNEIIIGENISFKSQSQDVWITTKVKSQLVATSGLRSGSIKVITENSTVYLIGVLTKKQAILAVEVTRKVSGVKRVVKAFEYLVAKKKSVPSKK